MNEIQLYIENGVWMARHVGPHGNRIKALFATNTLPTAFRWQMPGAEVLATLKRLNPGAVVRDFSGAGWEDNLEAASEAAREQ
jgi:hypothetical protein